MLDFLKIPKWKEVQKDFKQTESESEYDHYTDEADYWCIDTEIEQKELVEPQEFYRQCIACFEKIGWKEGYIYGNIVSNPDIKNIGEKE